VDEEEETVPWWFESFRWGISSRGENIYEVEDELSNLQNFDASTTRINEPILADESIVTVLKGFHDLGEAINDSVGLQKERDLPLPPKAFEITDGSIETTREFKDWFEQQLLELCPPFNEELTSLIMVSSNVKVEAIDGLVPDELMNNLESIGIVQDGGNNRRVYNEDYHEAIIEVLKYMKGIFDIGLDTPHKNLELLFYQSWADSNKEDSEEIVKWLEKASSRRPDTLSKGEEPHFGKQSFGIPVHGTLYSYSSLQIVYTTMRVTKNKGKYTHGENYEKVNQIMREAGILEE
jgi:hypothetical protein